VCKGHPAKIEHTLELEPLTHKNLDDLGSEYLLRGDPFCTSLDVAKFLCGIQTPFFTRAKVKNLPNFGVLQHYPFMEVKTWVEAQMRMR
jgi:ATP-dependent DNA helicase RecQ